MLGVVADGISNMELVSAGQRTSGEGSVSVIGTAIFAFVWVCYLRTSKRVKETFPDRPARIEPLRRRDAAPVSCCSERRALAEDVS